jgi:anti-sigma factor RsiW
MTCEELLKALNDYVDGEQLTQICEEFAAHLQGCDPCQVVVDNIRQSIALYKNGEPYRMPEEFTAKLQLTLRQQWEKKFGVR